MNMDLKWLDYSLPYHWWIDGLRYITVAGATVLVVMALKFALTRTKQHRQQARFWALAGLGVMASLQELQQIHHPMLWWRLPGFLLLLSIAIYGVLER